MHYLRCALSVVCVAHIWGPFSQHCPPCLRVECGAPLAQECFCPGQHVIVCDDNLKSLRAFSG
eukprot:5612375-Alexandrium_andersonii.AAC.1